jgi:hypothetical protein
MHRTSIQTTRLSSGVVPPLDQLIQYLGCGDSECPIPGTQPGLPGRPKRQCTKRDRIDGQRELINDTGA